MLKSKTVYAALAACLTSIGAYMAQEVSMAEMMQVCVTSVLAIFLRHGVAKTQQSAEAAVEAASSAATPVKVAKVSKKKASG
tara:strand:+ start:128 stop:373 length:246 start_codon:yes stop_codon:yes gene_type:complete